MTTNYTKGSLSGNALSCPVTAETAFPCSSETDRDSCERPCKPCCERPCRPCEESRDDSCQTVETPIACPCDPDPDPIPDVPCDCCKASMNEALHILCGADLNELVDFNSFFFLTKSLSIGGPLGATLPAGDPGDNIASATASLERFSPCNCDLLEISGTAYFANPNSPTPALEDVDAISMCALRAVAFQLTPGTDPEDEQTRNRRVLRLIRRAIRCAGGTTGSCGACQAHCDCDTCCCNTGLLIELSSRNLSRQATFTAGPLLLRDVTVLGNTGSTLILWNEVNRRVYLVCVDAIEVLG